MHPRSELIGVSTVGGNQTLDKVTKNALNALNLLGLGGRIPCVKGQEHALMSATVACPEIHGETGLDLKHKNIGFPSHSFQPTPGKGITVMADVIHQQKRKVKLVATGRLTNVALLLQVYPEVMKNIEEIVIMGGAMRGGNTHPVYVVSIVFYWAVHYSPNCFMHFT